MICCTQISNYDKAPPRVHGVLFKVSKEDLKKIQSQARMDGFVCMPLEVRCVSHSKVKGMRNLASHHGCSHPSPKLLSISCCVDLSGQGVLFAEQVSIEPLTLWNGMKWWSVVHLVQTLSIFSTHLWWSVEMHPDVWYEIFCPVILFQTCSN